MARFTPTDTHDRKYDVFVRETEHNASHFLLYINAGTPRKLTRAIELLTFVWEYSNSNIDRDIGCPDWGSS
jgi:hypothetical protein